MPKPVQKRYCRKKNTLSARFQGISFLRTLLHIGNVFLECFFVSFPKCLLADNIDLRLEMRGKLLIDLLGIAHKVTPRFVNYDMPSPLPAVGVKSTVLICA